MNIENQKRLIKRIQLERRCEGLNLIKNKDNEAIGQALIEEAEALEKVLDSLHALEAWHTALVLMRDVEA